MVHFKRFCPLPCTIMQDAPLQLDVWLESARNIQEQSIQKVQLYENLKHERLQRMRLKNHSGWCFTKCLFISVCQHCKENEERPSCDRGVWWRSSTQKVSQWNCRPQAAASRGKWSLFFPSFYFFVFSHGLFCHITASCMSTAFSTQWLMDDTPPHTHTGFFSHTDHSDREEGSLPVAPRKGSTPERTRGQNQKPD